MSKFIKYMGALAAVIACTSCLGRCGSSTPTGSNVETTGAATGSSGASGVAIRDLGALADRVAASARALPRAEFDPAALVEAQGKDPQRLFEWVRDRTWWAPYRGLLRGSQGVMLDRLGSNLDRAVLLGDLLRLAGSQVRLAGARMTDEKARDLLGRVRPIPDKRREPVPPPPQSPDDLRAAERIMPGYEKEAAAAETVARHRWADGQSLFRTQSEGLLTRLKHVISQSRPHTDEAAIQAMADHWWIERNDGNQWVPMDVLLPDARIGVATAPAVRTVDWPATAAVPPIPADDSHSVRIRIVVERYQSGSTAEAVALEAVLRPVDTLDRPVTFTNFPTSAGGTSPTGQLDPGGLRRIALETKRWLPAISVGQQVTASAGFDDTGRIVQNVLAPPKFDPAGSVGGLGSALGGGEDEPATLSAQWIDFEIHTPGQPVQLARRTVFDALGPVWRAGSRAPLDGQAEALRLSRAEALGSKTAILLQSSDYTEEFVFHLESSSVVANREGFHQLANAQDPAAVRSIAQSIISKVEMWSSLPDLARLRAQLGQVHGWLIDRTNVLTYRLTPGVQDPTRVAESELVDLATNGGGSRPGASAEAFRLRVQQGVADTVAELMVVSLDLRGAPNTAALFAANGDAANWTVVDAGDVATAGRLGWPHEAEARLLEDIRSGFTAVVPKQPVTLGDRPRLGWWRVDPKTGDTVGVMDTGFRQGAPEDATVREKVKELQAWLTRTQAQARGPMTGSNAQQIVRLQNRRREISNLIQEAYAHGFMRTPIKPGPSNAGSRP